MVKQRSKAPLALMEQVIMVLVFAMAAVLCIQAFVVAGQFSKESNGIDKAAIVGQTMAELAKSQRGQVQEEIYYTTDWEVTDEAYGVYLVRFHKNATDGLLGSGTVTVTRIEDNKELFAINAAWQEGAYE